MKEIYYRLNFKASHCWINKFMKRRDISVKAVTSVGWEEKCLLSNDIYNTIISVTISIIIHIFIIMYIIYNNNNIGCFNKDCMMFSVN